MPQTPGRGIPGQGLLKKPLLPQTPAGVSDEHLPTPKQAFRYSLYILLPTCFLTFGSYWVFDTPGAIQTQLTQWFGPANYSDSKNLLLYSVYSWPNTILALFGGSIIDKVTGVRWGAFLFCALILLGQGMFTMGVIAKSYPICVAGRFVFGLGGESLTVAQNTMVVRWFKGPLLALTFGMVVSFARVGSAVNFLVTPALAAKGVPLSIWLGFFLCAGSLGACCVLVALDAFGAKYRATLKKQIEESEGIEEDEDSDVLPEINKANKKGFKAAAKEFWNNLRSFPLAAFLLFAICLTFYVSVLTYYTVGSSIMQHSGHHWDSDSATNFLAIPNLLSIFLSPFFGSLVDRKGRALYFLLVASIIMIIVHLHTIGNALCWFDIPPYILVTLLGLGYALGAASMWPILSHIIAPEVLGMGYGCMTAVQNTGLALFPQVIGAVQDADSIKDTNWKNVAPLMILAGSACLSLILTFALIFVDRSRHNGTLNASSSERSEIKKVERANSRANSVRISRKPLLGPNKKGHSSRTHYSASDDSGDDSFSDSDMPVAFRDARRKKKKLQQRSREI